MFRINNSPKLYPRVLKLQYVGCKYKRCPGKRDDNMCAHFAGQSISLCVEIDRIALAEYLANYMKGGKPCT